MCNFLSYEIKASVLLAVFFVFYKLLVSNEKMHRINRVVILATSVLSFLLPLCVLTIHKTIEMPFTASGNMLLPMPLSAEEVPFEKSVVPVRLFDWQMLAVALYIIGVVAVLSKFALGVVRLSKLIKSGERRSMNGSEVVVVKRDVPPFSCLKWIVMCEDDFESGNNHILEHEKAHIALCHSRDVLLMNVICALQWFNPFVWLMKNDLRAIHEYEADDSVLRKGVNIKEYQYSLIRKVVSASGYSITNNFNHSILKNRITMMSKSKPSMSRALRVLYIVPIVGVSLAVNARTVVNYKSSENPLVSLADSSGKVVNLEIKAEVQSGQPYFDEETGIIQAVDKVNYRYEVNGKFCDENLAQTLPPLLEGGGTIVADCPSSMPMGVFEDIKSELRYIPNVKIQCMMDGDVESSTNYLNVLEPMTDLRDLGNSRFVLLINKNDKLLVDGALCTIDDISKKVSQFARKECKANNAKRGVVNVVNDRGTSFGAFVKALEEAHKGIDIVRDEYAKDKFGKPFSELSDVQQAEVADKVSLNFVLSQSIRVSK